MSRGTDYAGIADEYVGYSYAGSTDQLFSLTTYAGLDTSGVVTGTELYAYDANGFMTRKEVSTDAAADLEWTHVYTPSIEGRLATYSRTDHDGANDISPAITYDYNKSGIRVRADDRYFLVDSLNPTGYAQVLIERVSLQGAAIKKYALGDDVLGQGVGTSMQSLLMDGHGSTRQLYSGSVIERYDYDAYGEAFHYELDKPDSIIARPATDLLYAGEQWDADLGMQYLRARYYMPEQGVFNRLDPFFGNTDDPQSLHKYAYTHGDPVNGIDPSGLFSITNMTLSISIATGISGATAANLLGASAVESILIGARLGAGTGIVLALNRGRPAEIAKAVVFSALSGLQRVLELIAVSAFVSPFDGFQGGGRELALTFLRGLSDGIFGIAIAQLQSAGLKKIEFDGMSIQELEYYTAIMVKEFVKFMVKFVPKVMDGTIKQSDVWKYMFVFVIKTLVRVGVVHVIMRRSGRSSNSTEEFSLEVADIISAGAFLVVGPYIEVSMATHGLNP